MKFPFLAVDIGNARMKVGLFGPLIANALPEPQRTLSLEGEAPQLDGLMPWLNDVAAEKMPWILASVNRPGATRLINWLRERRPVDSVTLLCAGDLPLVVRLERPDMVGIDRLVDAVAVNRLREPGRPAVIVDVGTAITVDLVSADGAFLGGAILPGLAISARALHEFTDLLPHLDISEFSDPPPALGMSTEAAMRSGLFWGTVGAIRQLTDQLGRDAGGSLQVFLTGGAAATVAELLAPDAQYVPHLTLAGIALSIEHREQAPGLNKRH